MTCLLTLTLAAASLLILDLDGIRSEPNLERRARLALDHASECFTGAKTAYADGHIEKTEEQLKEIQSSVELARDALSQTGKNPRRHARPFKLAETDTRSLLRKMEGLENSMDLDDRKLMEGPKGKVQEVHDEWLNQIISGRR